MKIINSKSILALTLAIAIGSMPVKANADHNDCEKALFADRDIDLDAKILQGMISGYEETEYVNYEENAVRYLCERKAKQLEQARQALQAIEANRQWQNCIFDCTW